MRPSTLRPISGPLVYGNLADAEKAADCYRAHGYLVKVQPVTFRSARYFLTVTVAS